MEPHQISVTLSLGSDPFQAGLPAALFRQNMLSRVLRFGPAPAILEPDDAGSLKVVKNFPSYETVSRFLWGAWRRVPGRGQSHLPIVATTWFADRLASKYVPPSSIFHGWVSLCQACLRAAKRQGAATIVHNPTSHFLRWQNEVMKECRRFGVSPRHCTSVMPGSLIRRAQREYELCDKIVVLSEFSRRTFEEFGLANKVVSVWPGVDHHFFSPPPNPRESDVFRVCFVGRVELAKGVAYLLEAWKRLKLHKAELALVGPILPELANQIKDATQNNIITTGWLPPKEVAEQYRAADLFVMPSISEGLANVLLEAMASGLPVVATKQSGAEDCVTGANEGFLVPAGDVDALADAILWCYDHRGETTAMGRAARARIEQQFTLSHYENRQIAMYRSLAI